MSTQGDNLKAIADAIREQEGSTGAIPASQFATRIKAIEKEVPRTIMVSVETGSTVTCTDGKTTLTKTSVGGQCVFDLPYDGDWVVQAKHGTATSPKSSVDIANRREIELNYANIFGVFHEEGYYSSSLVRLTRDTDPYGYVTVDVTTEPVAASSTVEGSSMFDGYLPWKGMEEYNIINNAIGPKKGEAGFSRTEHDVVVYIPEFYYRIFKAGTPEKHYFYVSDKPCEGFAKHPGSGKYVARYKTTRKTIGGDHFSLPGYGEIPSGGSNSDYYLSLSVARKKAIAKGDRWGVLDYPSVFALQLLFTVEYASFTGTNIIGKGASGSTGGTDAMAFHTGTTATSASAYTQKDIQYRWIENLWGIYGTLIDGIFLGPERRVCICLNRDKYGNVIDENYIALNQLPRTNSSSGIAGLSCAEEYPWVFSVGRTVESHPAFNALYSCQVFPTKEAPCGFSSCYAELFAFHWADPTNSTSGRSSRLMFHS